MNPISFECANDTLLGGPALDYGTPTDVPDLPIWRGDQLVISCWKPSFLDKVRLLLGGFVWVYVKADTHPPISLQTEDPFV